MCGNYYTNETMTGDIAVGTKVFKRTDKLKQLLTSIPNYVKTVYVADDGRTTERSEIYSEQYPFKLKVIDLEYDKGLGAGRHAIVEALSEEYLLIVDTDHTLPENIETLRNVLRADDSLGGVAGSIFEPNEPAYYITGQFFQEVNNELHRGPFINKNIGTKVVDDNPLIHFDFIANAAMFKKDCLESYNWDPEYVIGYEHVDFYIGHWKTTEWEFGVCPSVVFNHYPGGNADYDMDRTNENKLLNSERYFLNKWSYEKDVTRGFRWVRGPPNESWYFKGEMSTWQKALIILFIDGPNKLFNRIMENIR